MTNIISVVERYGRKLVCSLGKIHTVAVITEAASDDILAGMPRRRNAPVDFALFPTLLFVEYIGDDI